MNEAYLDIFSEEDWGVDLIEGGGEVIHGAGCGIGTRDNGFTGA